MNPTRVGPARVTPTPDRSKPTALRVARHAWALCRRNIVQMRSEPMQLLDAALMPIVFSVIFLCIFGGAVGGGTARYRDYLMPGILVETVVFAARTTGVALNLDSSTGLLDRFRALPVSHWSVLIGRIGTDAVRMLFGQLTVFGFALLLGFRVQTGPLALLGAMLLLLGFGTAISWVTACVGLTVRSPQTVDNAGFIWMIPLQFGSSLFVPTSTMPGWLRAFAEINPLTLSCDAVRALLVGGPTMRPLLGALVWIVGLTAVFGPLAVRQYGRRS
jgi:oleandomycin transport system permease protein